MEKLKGLAWKVLLPVCIGLAVVAWLFHNEFNMSEIGQVDFGWRAVAGILLALVFVVGRDFGLTWRFRTIAKPDLTWGQSVKVDLMCAFSSAITPSVVGGSAMAIFFLNTEGIKVGRATALTLTTLFLDELFFVVFCPIILLLLPLDDLFGGTSAGEFLDTIKLVFWLVYAGIVAWTAILFVGILLKPTWVRDMLVKTFSLPMLRRWKDKIAKTGDNLVTTSEWIKQCPPSWWIQVICATILSWFSRYLIVNALFWGFCPDSSPFLVFARQFVVWVVLMVSPTPGGSGFSEWIFARYYSDMIGSPDLSLIIALIWRLITYYIYLAIGVVLVTTYFKRFKKNNINPEKTEYDE